MTIRVAGQNASPDNLTLSVGTVGRPRMTTAEDSGEQSTLDAQIAFVQMAGPSYRARFVIGGVGTLFVGAFVVSVSPADGLTRLINAAFLGFVIWFTATHRTAMLWSRYWEEKLQQIRSAARDCGDASSAASPEANSGASTHRRRSPVSVTSRRRPVTPLNTPGVWVACIGAAAAVITAIINNL